MVERHWTRWYERRLVGVVGREMSIAGYYGQIMSFSDLKGRMLKVLLEYVEDSFLKDQSSLDGLLCIIQYLLLGKGF